MSAGRLGRRFDIKLMEGRVLTLKKTQIQVPEEQMARIREFAKKREWSMAETFRRGVEMLMDTYGPGEAAKAEDWEFPTSGKRHWKGLSDGELRDISAGAQTRWKS